jgi:hypothetical protein
VTLPVWAGPPCKWGSSLGGPSIQHPPLLALLPFPCPLITLSAWEMEALHPHLHTCLPPEFPAALPTSHDNSAEAPCPPHRPLLLSLEDAAPSLPQLHSPASGYLLHSSSQAQQASQCLYKVGSPRTSLTPIQCWNRDLSSHLPRTHVKTRPESALGPLPIATPGPATVLTSRDGAGARPPPPAIFFWSICPYFLAPRPGSFPLL